MATAAERAHREVVRFAHRGFDLFTFLRRTEEQLRRVVDYEGAACFFTIDPATLLLTGHINGDLARDDERRRAVNAGVAHNEYREEDVNKFARLATDRSRTGILAEATDGDPDRSPRYGSLIRPFGLEGELRAAFVVDGACWGGLALFRTPDQPPFERRDARFVETISRHVAEGMRTALVLGTIDRETGPGTPGLVLLDEAGRVEAVNESATAYLEELIDPGPPRSGSLPEVVHAVVEEARRGAAGESAHGPVRHRVPTRTGSWVILHGTVFAGEREGAAVIIEPARAPEIAPLLLEAHGLSDREQTVTLCVLRGLSTAEIARQLFISPYTVQDHLKAIFEKVGVRSRKALVAKVFFDHYLPRMQEEDPIGSVQPFEEVSGLAAVD